MVDFTPLFIFRINLYIFLIHLSLDELLFFFHIIFWIQTKIIIKFFFLCDLFPIFFCVGKKEEKCYGQVVFTQLTVYDYFMLLSLQYTKKECLF